MSNLKEIEAAAKESTAKILKQINRINNSQFESILAELKKNGVDNEIIEELKAVIDDVTQRNKRLAAFIKKGGKVGEMIVRAVGSVRLEMG